MTETADLRRTRNAERTRSKLLAAGRARFAAEGYQTATAKAIADDAGVNASLVNRYFGSKQGLFEACLGEIEAFMHDILGGLVSPESVATMLARTTAPKPGADAETRAAALTLLLRSSGDADADGMRVRLLERISLATASAGTPDPSEADVVRAQILLCTGIGLALATKWAPPLEPLASASPELIERATSDLVRALLGDGSEVDGSEVDGSEVDGAGPEPLKG